MEDQQQVYLRPAGIVYDQLLATRLQKVQYANQVKLKLKKLLHQIDGLGTGQCSVQVFFDILALHEVQLKDLDKKRIVRVFGCDKQGMRTNGKATEVYDKGVNRRQSDCLRYKEALSQIFLDPDSEVNKWILRVQNHGKAVPNQSDISQGSSSLTTLQKSDQKTRGSRSFSQIQSIIPRSTSQTQEEEESDLNISIKGSAGDLTANLLKKFTQQTVPSIADPYSNLPAPVHTRTNGSRSGSLRETQRSLNTISIQQINQALSKERGKRRYKDRLFNYSSINYDLLRDEASRGRVSFVSLEIDSINSTSGGLSKLSQFRSGRPQTLKSHGSDKFLKTLMKDEFTGGFRKDYLQIAKILQCLPLKLDLRLFSNLKSQLSQLNLQDANLIPERLFHELFMQNFKLISSSTQLYQLLLPLFLHSPDKETLLNRPLKYVRFDNFCSFLDFLQYLPQRSQVQKNTSSQETYDALNTKEYTHDHQQDPAGNSQDFQAPLTQSEKQQLETMAIDDMLATIEIKLNERFSSLIQAFRAFDVNNNGSLSINEFSQGVETYLKIKLSQDEMRRVFQYLDSREAGQISFNEFCHIQQGNDSPDEKQKSSTIYVEKIEIANKREASQSKSSSLLFSRGSASQLPRLTHNKSLNQDLEHLSTSEAQPSNYLQKLQDIIKSRQKVVTVKDSRAIYQTNPLILTKPNQTSNDTLSNLNLHRSTTQHKYDAVSNEKKDDQHPYENLTAPKEMPMRNLMIQEYYDNKRSLDKASRGSAGQVSRSTIYGLKNSTMKTSHDFFIKQLE